MVNTFLKTFEDRVSVIDSSFISDTIPDYVGYHLSTLTPDEQMTFLEKHYCCQHPRTTPDVWITSFIQISLPLWRKHESPI